MSPATHEAGQVAQRMSEIGHNREGFGEELCYKKEMVPGVTGAPFLRIIFSILLGI
jgi:hypothetical protein